MADFKSKLGFLVLLHVQGIDVVCAQIDACRLYILVDFLAELLVHPFLVLVKRHVCLVKRFFDVQVVCNSPFMHIGFERRLNGVFDSADERLIHHVLIPEIWHLIACRSVDVATELGFFLFLGCLSSFDPLYILLEFSLTLLCFPIVLLSLWALHLMVEFVLDGCKLVLDIIGAVAFQRCSILSNLWISVVKPSSELPSVFTFSLVFNESRDVTEIVPSVVLACIDSFASSISATSDVELPLSVLLELVVLVKGTNKNFAF